MLIFFDFLFVCFFCFFFSILCIDEKICNAYGKITLMPYSMYVQITCSCKKKNQVCTCGAVVTPLVLVPYYFDGFLVSENMNRFDTDKAFPKNCWIRLLALCRVPSHPVLPSAAARAFARENQRCWNFHDTETACWLQGHAVTFLGWSLYVHALTLPVLTSRLWPIIGATELGALFSSKIRVSRFLFRR